MNKKRRTVQLRGEKRKGRGEDVADCSTADEKKKRSIYGCGELRQQAAARKERTGRRTTTCGIM